MSNEINHSDLDHSLGSLPPPDPSDRVPRSQLTPEQLEISISGLVDELVAKKLEAKNREIKQLKAENEELKHDNLTGLRRRSAVKEVVKNIESNPNLDFFVIVMDLNSFKEVNDVYGHEAGDNKLKLFATACMNSVRTKHAFMLEANEDQRKGQQVEDIAMRYGGDEFVFVGTGDEDTGWQVAMRIEEEFASLQSSSEQEPTIQPIVTCSFGVSSINKHGRSYDEAVRAADRDSLGKIKGHSFIRRQKRSG